MDEVLARLEALSSAEEFFHALGVDYDEAVLRVNRLHILQRFHTYLRAAPREEIAGDTEAATRLCASLLTRAYEDFVRSDALTERVFKVFAKADGRAFVALNAVEPMKEQ